jgi:ubiquinone/menaquinone biosynthesis C-methylase UbiE
MKFNLVSYLDMPPMLRINGLMNVRESVSRPREAAKAEGFDLQVQDHVYVRYGTRPKAEDLHDCGLWLQNELPFFFEVEEEVRVGWGQLLPEEVILDGQKFTRTFDRYYFGQELKEKHIEFVFDYMAPTYDADIEMGMNLDINGKLLERIAEVESVPPGIVKVLDYGAGTGICADAQPQVKEEKHLYWEITGLDISRLMLAKAREKLYSATDNPDSLLYEVKLVEDTMFAEESFDAAMACFTVHYFLDSKPYKNIYDSLKPKRPFVCNVSQNKILEIENRVKQVGFHLVGDRHILSYEVKGQSVAILTFIK